MIPTACEPLQDPPGASIWLRPGVLTSPAPRSPRLSDGFRIVTAASLSASRSNEKLDRLGPARADRGACRTAESFRLQTYSDLPQRRGREGISHFAQSRSRNLRANAVKPVAPTCAGLQFEQESGCGDGLSLVPWSTPSKKSSESLDSHVEVAGRREDPTPTLKI
jgi:hypothetical protein